MRDQVDDRLWKGSPWVSVVVVLVVHVCCLAIATGLLRHWGLVSNGAQALLHGDAEHYSTIASTGYEGFLAAFFPLFPFLWRFLDIGPVGMAVVNAAIYLVSFSVLGFSLRVQGRMLLVWATIPSAIFYFLPYSESLFFLGGVVLLLGLRKASLWTTCVGLLVCTMTRPAFTVLLLALATAEILSSGFKKQAVFRTGAYVCTSLLGLFSVAWVQYLDTGCWTCFWTVQKGWGNELRVPSFPLSSWGGGTIVRLDSVALLVGLCAAGYLVFLLLQRNKGALPGKDVITSYAYLASISILVLFMRGGELFSLNRFVFATPFALVCIQHWRPPAYLSNWRALLALGLGLMAYFMAFGAYLHIRVFVFYALVTSLLLLYGNMSAGGNEAQRWRFPLYLIIAFEIQVLLLLRFLNGQWVA